MSLIFTDGVSLEFQDDAGRIVMASQQVVSLIPQADLVNFVAAYAAASDAGVMEAVHQTVIVGAGTQPNQFAFYTAFDWAALVFVSLAGRAVRRMIPAPDASIFFGDAETVDPASPLVQAVVAAEMLSGVDAGGSPLVRFSSGVRIRTL